MGRRGAGDGGGWTWSLVPAGLAGPDEPNADAARDRPRLPRSIPEPHEPADALLGPLAAASVALARLDARAETESAPVRVGLISRLAAQGVTNLPLDLALRDSERIGRREVWTLGRPLRADRPGCRTTPGCGTHRLLRDFLWDQAAATVGKRRSLNLGRDRMAA
ncbi:hypothetical protein [Acidisphaera sp. S103]|uniref:hypothetical protein n=1 Tax=Acidisphaera sp. S103 TaxID=1747223 RepID=UPI00131C94DA|nr:hypothetical protein [Acidisphaera sp. S103]